jgi:hypothetical protein
MSTQLIAFSNDPAMKVFHYGELIENHVMRSPKRAIYSSNVRIVPISSEWKTYLVGRTLEIEQPGDKWLKVTIRSCLKYMLLHDSGYTMPLLITKSKNLEVFQKMETEVPMPVQKVRAPPPVVSSAPAVSKPVSSVPVVSKPVSSAPAVSKPVSSVPVVSKPVSSAPAVSKPVSSVPVVSKPVSSAPIKSSMKKVIKHTVPRDDDSDNDAVCDDDGEESSHDEWTKSRDALSAAVHTIIKSKKSKVSFAK